ncbi:MAG TPA: CBS domain-containing protein, partial [Candidatus Woesearchaeota archaeon]|nr:CBS domain-containing protein [Candidatus Woesearchaeota archaeon]
SMTEAINTMAKAGISSVVVVENRRVVGILTARDILKDYVKS